MTEVIVVGADQDIFGARRIAFRWDHRNDVVITLFDLFHARGDFHFHLWNGEAAERSYLSARERSAVRRFFSSFGGEGRPALRRLGEGGGEEALCRARVGG